MTEIELQAELNDLRMSKEAQPLFDAVKRHIAENVDPVTEEFFRLGEGRADRWSWAPGQLENELALNGWLTVPFSHALLFDCPVNERYDIALRQLGITRASLSAIAGHG